MITLFKTVLNLAEKSLKSTEISKKSQVFEKRIRKFQVFGKNCKDFEVFEKFRFFERIAEISRI